LNRPNYRQVLECASPLALSEGESPNKGGKVLPQSKTFRGISDPGWSDLVAEWKESAMRDSGCSRGAYAFMQMRYKEIHDS